MKQEQIELINQAIDNHFKSNKGNFAVEGYASPWMNKDLCLSAVHYLGVCIRPVHVALFVLRNYPEIEAIHYGTWIFTRSSMRLAGRKC